MTRRRLAGLLLAGALSAALGLTVAAPANAAGGPYIIRNTGSGKCLQPANDSLDLGVAIVQEPCDGRASQNWFRTGNSDFTDRFVNQHSNLCLDARGGATNGTPVQQWACNSISNEKWAAAVSLPNITQVVSRVSNTTSHCLDDPWQSTENDTPMQIWACNTTSAQVWFIG